MKQISSPRSRIQIPWFSGGASGVWNAHVVCEANREGDPKKLITKIQQQNTALIDNSGVPNTHNFICESGRIIVTMIMIMIMIMITTIIIIIIIIINIVIISISISITIQLPLLLLLS